MQIDEKKIFCMASLDVIIKLIVLNAVIYIDVNFIICMHLWNLDLYFQWSLHVKNIFEKNPY